MRKQQILISSLYDTNRFLYYLQKVPFSKYFFSRDFFSDYESKKGIIEAFQIIKAILFLFLSIAILYVIKEIYSFTVEIPSTKNFFTFFTLLCFSYCTYKKILSFHEKDYLFVNLFKVDAKEYTCQQINQYVMKVLIFFSFAIICLRNTLSENIMPLFLLIPIFLSIKLIFQVMELKHFEKESQIVIQNPLYKKVFAIFYFSVGLYANYFLNKYVSVPLIFVILFYAILFLCGIYSYLNLLYYENYPAIYNKVLTKENLSLKKLKIYYHEVKEEKEEIKLESKGIERIHDLLEIRRKTSIENYFKYINYLEKFLCVSLFIAVIICKWKKFSISLEILPLLSTIFFVTQAISSSRNYMEVCFYEMDRFLFQHSVFCDAMQMIRNYKLRIQRILKQDKKNDMLLIVIYFLLYFLGHQEINFFYFLFVPFFIIICRLFSVIFYVSIYYLLKPYSFDGTTSPFYKILDVILMMISYGLILYPNFILIGSIFVILITLSISMYYLTLKSLGKKRRY